MSLKKRLGDPNGVGQAFRSIVREQQGSRKPPPEYMSASYITLKTKVQEQLLNQEANPEALDADQLRHRILAIVSEDRSISPLERDSIVTNLVNEIKGFGPVQPLLDDPDISEVMINGPHQVYIERAGRLEQTQIRFRDDAHLKSILEKMLAPTGRRLDEASPMVDSRLPDGSRLNAVIRPIAVNGDVVTIRKFSKDPFTLEQLVHMNTISPQMRMVLEAAVRGRVSIIVSGGTGSGKTTTLNALSAKIPDDERIVTIEDAAELQLQQDHLVTLEARPANVEGQGEVNIRSLVRNALRMRPDRIIVGEVRGGEALDMLQAMNTGHEGSLTTAHANSPRDCLARMETMVLMAGADLPLTAIRQQVASAIDLIVQQARLQDGSRRIVQVTEVVGMEQGIITTQDLFVYHQTGVNAEGRVEGYFAATGIRPRFLEQLARRGIELPPEAFDGVV
jgi:pilus assembly protein CpaF